MNKLIGQNMLDKVRFALLKFLKRIIFANFYFLESLFYYKNLKNKKKFVYIALITIFAKQAMQYYLCLIF